MAVRSVGGSSRVANIVAAATKGIVVSRTEQLAAISAHRNIDRNFKSYVQAGIREKSFLIIAVDDLTDMRCVQRRDSPNILRIRKMAVAQVIQPPPGIGAAVAHDERHQPNIDVRLFLQIFDEKYFVVGGGNYLMMILS